MRNMETSSLVTMEGEHLMGQDRADSIRRSRPPRGHQTWHSRSNQGGSFDIDLGKTQRMGNRHFSQSEIALVSPCATQV